jgi:hypothetical protein
LETHAEGVQKVTSSCQTLCSPNNYIY